MVKHGIEWFIAGSAVYSRFRQLPPKLLVLTFKSELFWDWLAQERAPTAAGVTLVIVCHRTLSGTLFNIEMCLA